MTRYFNFEATDNTGGRGESYHQPSAVRLGGSWNSGTNAGSRCSLWSRDRESHPAPAGFFL